MLQVDVYMQRMFACAAVILFAAAAAFLLSDLVNLFSGTFFRVFYTTEQKLPILLFIGWGVCYVCARSTCVCAGGGLMMSMLGEQVTLYAIPPAIVVLTITLHTTVFHIAAYLFLAYNHYFHEDHCELFL